MSKNYQLLAIAALLAAITTSVAAAPYDKAAQLEVRFFVPPTVQPLNGATRLIGTRNLLGMPCCEPSSSAECDGFYRDMDTKISSVATLVKDHPG